MSGEIVQAMSASLLPSPQGAGSGNIWVWKTLSLQLLLSEVSCSCHHLSSQSLPDIGKLTCAVSVVMQVECTLQEDALAENGAVFDIAAVKGLTSSDVVLTNEMVAISRAEVECLVAVHHGRKPSTASKRKNGRSLAVSPMACCMSLMFLFPPECLSGSTFLHHDAEYFCQWCVCYVEGSNKEEATIRQISREDLLSDAWR